MRVAPGPESAPTFPDEATTVTRKVAENTAAPGGNVGAPVTAMAANADEDLEYTLEGTDAKYFNIDDMGQITVGGDDPNTGGVTEPGTDPELDYDDPAKPKMFSVTVKVEVTGGDANQKAQVDVNIIVTDVNEIPVITDEDVDNPPMTAIMYPEIDNDGAPNTAAVATYAGTDPEGATISWDLRGADAALFTIADGVLQFKKGPDFENTKDKAGADTATPDATGNDNVYDIVVRAIASRAPGDTGPAETVDTTVAVTVTDVDEDGDVILSLLQPEVGIAIMASLTDSDGGVTDTTWEWKVSEVEADVLDIDNDDHWGDAPGTENQETYTPNGADLTNNPDQTTDDDPIDEGKFLRVTASYSDTNGADKTAHAMSANPVQARGLGGKNQSPDFVGDKVELSVAETAEVGDDVPGPVVATVRAPSSTDILTYRLRAYDATTDLGSTGVTTPADAAADVAAFDIDKETGQITVAQKLDFESRGPTGSRNGEYVVVATVTDPSNLGDSIVVVITAEDMNEHPVLSGRPELTINEIDSGDEDPTNPDFVGNPGPPGSVNVYGVVDEDRRAATEEWRLEGEDKGQFQLIGNVGRTLVFTTQPDYENPADANGDNVYKVTVVTFDGEGGRGEFDVCIAVMNIDEAGKITLRDEDGEELVQPYAQGPITADLTDPDGGVTDVSWVWSRAQVDPPTGTDPRNPITGATSATYTPDNDDTSYYLHVAATYMDAKNDVEDTDDRIADVTAAHAVLEVEDLKRAPAFPDDATEVEVAENSPSTTYVGEVIVAAVDPDKGTTLIYTLGGEDAALFALAMVDDDNDDQTPEVVTRQIVVTQPLPNDENNADMWDKVDLDHEDDKKNSYEVELKASDGNDETDDATITVTIRVTDRNEAPSVPMAGSGAVTTPTNNAPEFAAATDTREVAENTVAGENIGAPVEATDADAGDTLTYTLGGADMASFDIDPDTGRLMTKDPLDFETKATYTVEVTADDGNGGTVTITVTITVTDVDEPGNNAPEFASTETGARSVAENTAAGENIGALVEATDADAGDMLTYTLGGADMASFDIDPDTGQLMTKDPLDFETKATYTVEVTADDGNGGTDTISVTITVTDLNEDVIPGDTNNDGMIDKPEVIAAFRAYIDGDINKPEIIQIFRQYVVDAASSQ